MPNNDTPKLCCGKPPRQFWDHRVGSDTQEYIVSCCRCDKWVHATTKEEAITLWNAKSNAKPRPSGRR